MPLGIPVTGYRKGVQLDSPPSHDVRPLKGGLTVATHVVSPPGNRSSSQRGAIGAPRQLETEAPSSSTRPWWEAGGDTASRVGRAGAPGAGERAPGSEARSLLPTTGGWVSSPVRAPLQTVARRRKWLHSFTLAWRIPWREEPGGLLFMGSQSRTRPTRLSSSSSQDQVWLLEGRNQLSEDPPGQPVHKDPQGDSCRPTFLWHSCFSYFRACRVSSPTAGMTRAVLRPPSTLPCTAVGGEAVSSVAGQAVCLLLRA